MSDSPPTSCSQCAEQAQQIARLEQIVHQPAEQIQTLEQNAHKQTVRFPKSKRKLPADQKKPGRKGGHSHHKRAVPKKPDRTLQAPVSEVCPRCQVPWNISIYSQFQTDVPQVQPTTTEFQVQVGNCPCCGHTEQGRHPKQISDALGAANHVIGPNIQAMAAQLKHAAGVNYRRICRFLQDSFQLKVQHSTLVKAGARLAHKLAPTVTQIRKHLRASAFVNADETGWRVGSDSAWLWVFCNAQFTLFEVSPSRSQWVVKDQLTEQFEGVLCCDGLNSYDPLDFEKQRCCAHILRRISALKEQFAAEDEWSSELRALHQLQEIFQSAASLKANRDFLSGEEFGEHVRNSSRELSDWLERNDPVFFPGTHRAFGQLVAHLKRHESEWLHFLYRDEVDFTNNLAERQIPWGVITRKIGGCNQSWSGSWKTSRLASIFASCAQQSRSVFALIDQILHAREPTAIELSNLPSVA